MVGNELEAAHQFLSPAKYFAADLRISRSVESFVLSASSSRTFATSLTILASADSGLGPDEDGLGGVAGEPIDAVAVPVPKARTHWVNVSRAMPRSSAMPINVAPGVDSYRSTAYRRKSSV